MRTALLIALAVVLIFTAVAMAADPLEGTWKLNPAKSKFPAGQTPKSETVKNEAVENGIKQVFDGIGADGKSFRVEFTGIYDGKDYPVAGEPTMDSMAYTKPAPNTVSFVQKKGGKVVARGKCVISSDGKTSLVTYQQGADITEFWEKQ
jgi:hypothetical protein